jgi:hypothetical protein
VEEEEANGQQHTSHRTVFATRHAVDSGMNGESHRHPEPASWIPSRPGAGQPPPDRDTIDGTSIRVRSRQRRCALSVPVLAALVLFLLLHVVASTSVPPDPEKQGRSINPHSRPRDTSEEDKL